MNVIIQKILAIILSAIAAAFILVSFNVWHESILAVLILFSYLVFDYLIEKVTEKMKNKGD